LWSFPIVGWKKEKEKKRDEGVGKSWKEEREKKPNGRKK
jgi:hypothetical protein